MITMYYQRDAVVITEERAYIDGCHYHVARLANLMKVKRPHHPSVRVAAAITATEAVLAIPLIASVRTAAAFLFAVVALLVPGIAMLLCARRWPREIELVAHYGQREVTLFATADEQEFGQVARALQRAIEAHDR